MSDEQKQVHARARELVTDYGRTEALHIANIRRKTQPSIRYYWEAVIAAIESQGKESLP